MRKDRAGEGCGEDWNFARSLDAGIWGRRIWRGEQGLIESVFWLLSLYVSQKIDA